MTTSSNRAGRAKPVSFYGWLARTFVGLFAFIAVITLGGAAFEAIDSNSDAARLSPSGRLVDAGGFRLHINCVGTGSPTVVLDAGLGQTSLDWSLVQPELGRSTRVCAYDRAGMAWSEPSPNPRTPAVIAEELHKLLANADIAGPYVLVAHSLSGKYARMFAMRYPNDVAGFVLVDARHEYMDKTTSAAERQHFFDAIDAQGRDYAWARRLGVVRLFGASLAGTPSLPAETRSAMALLSTQTNAIAATRAEARARDANDGELQTATLGDRPLIVLVAGQSLAGIPHWVEAQRRQAALSSRGVTRIAPDSSHAIQLDDPRLVIEAVGEVVATARSEMQATPRG